LNLPDYIEQETWDAWIRHRKKKRCPVDDKDPRDLAVKRVIRKLTEFHIQGYQADEMLQESIERGWTTVFLYQDAPRRQSTPQEQNNVRQINGMVSSAFKVTK
jgi:hypothetical protein